MSTATSVDQLRQRLEAIAQDHLLAFYDELDHAQRAALLERINAIDLERVPQWVARQVLAKPAPAIDPASISPAPFYPADHADPARPWDRAAARRAGERIVRAGKLAAFTVAGGQGTRLGFDGPKGTFPATPITRKPLFAVFAEQILAAQRAYNAHIPWYIMTSPLNHDDTVSFFNRHRHFGLDPANISFFSQGVLPSFDKNTGKILLAAKHEPATNPDGHGGSLRALHASGALDDMRRRGIAHISYFQIDNPLARIVDTAFIGLHAEAPDSSAQMSSKMVAKANAAERVGVFCSVAGATQVIEYSDLPDHLANATDPEGRLRFNAGSIAIHLIAVDFIASLNSDREGFALPLHRAEKKVPYIDLETGRAVAPHTPNAVKLETFVFDALPMCRGSIVYQTVREDEFAPIKNADGSDSPATSADLQSRRAARWLEHAGVAIPRDQHGNPDCTIELSPLTALEPEDLINAPGLPTRINPGTKLVL